MTPNKKPKPYPWKCSACGQKAVQAAVVAHSETMLYGTERHEVSVPDLPVSQCTNCGTVLFDNRADELMGRALRRQLGLLQPDEIRAYRRSLKLKLRDLSVRLRYTIESLSRWENGWRIQSRRVNEQLVAYFTQPGYRRQLDQRARPTVGAAAEDVGHFGLGLGGWVQSTQTISVASVTVDAATPQYALAA